MRSSPTTNGTNSTIKAQDGVVVQATDVTPQTFKDRFATVLAADGTPAPDSDYDYGASLRQQRQESFGGQSIGTTQPGALMIGVAGGVAVGTGNDAGASAALGRIASVHEAVLEGSTVNASSVQVDATDATLMVNVGVGVAGTSGKVALVGSVAVTIDESRHGACRRLRQDHAGHHDGGRRPGVLRLGRQGLRHCRCHRHLDPGLGRRPGWHRGRQLGGVRGLGSQCDRERGRHAR